MKAIFPFILLLLSLTTFSQINSNDSITVKGITTKHNIYDQESRLDDVLINVYEFNTKISSFNSDTKGKFEFVIPKNSYIVLEFVKSNFVTKRILFDTRTEKETINTKPFNIELVMIESTKGIDYSDLDFPITRVEYIKKYKDYNYAEKYTELMIKKQEVILNEIRNKTTKTNP